MRATRSTEPSSAMFGSPWKPDGSLPYKADRRLSCKRDGRRRQRSDQPVKKLSGTLWSLVAVLVAYLIVDFLLTPLSGLETRPASDITAVGAASLGIFFVGAILTIVALVLLFRGRRAAPTVAIIAALLYLPGFLADRTGNLSKLQSPTAIFWLEWVQALIVAAVIVLSLRARTETTAGASD